jgi:hypothetical protein
LAKRIITVQDHIKPLHNAVKDVIAVSSKTDSGINQLRKEVLFLMGHLQPKSHYEEIQTLKQERIEKIEKNIRKFGSRK